MNPTEIIWKEIEQEAKGTREMLSRVPLEQGSWKPHEKSMNLSRLATHVAEMPQWVNMTLQTSELDFSKGEYKPFVPADKEALLAFFDQVLEGCKQSLHSLDSAVLNEMWTMKNGEQVFYTLPKSVVIRSMCLNHWYHHRGQLSVYLRLLNVPIPGIYGPTADER